MSKKSVKAEVSQDFGRLVLVAAPDLESDPTGLISEISEIIGMGLLRGLNTTITGMMPSANDKKHSMQGDAWKKN